MWGWCKITLVMIITHLILSSARAHGGMGFHYRPVTLRVWPVGDHLRPQNSRWSSEGCRPSCDGPADLRTCYCWPGTDLGPLCNQMVVERLSVVFYGLWWFSVVCDQSFTVGDCRMMVFSILAQTLGVRLVHDQSATSCPPVANQSPTSGRQSVQIVVGWSVTGRRWGAIYLQWFWGPIVAHWKYDRS